METYIFATTLMPRRAMSRFYAPLVASLPPGRVHHRAMTEGGGLGRTDLVVDAMRPGMEDARHRNVRLRLIGHSLGGVVAWALAHEYPDIVDEVELFATPVRGTLLGHPRLPLAEGRFLARTSRWLRQYDRPLDGPVVRSIYSYCDLWVRPPRSVSWVAGEQAENHFVVPFTLPRSCRREGETLHRGAIDHVNLPRHTGLLASLRAGQYGLCNAAS